MEIQIILETFENSNTEENFFARDIVETQFPDSGITINDENASESFLHISESSIEMRTDVNDQFQFLGKLNPFSDILEVDHLLFCCSQTIANLTQTTLDRQCRAKNQQEIWLGLTGMLIDIQKAIFDYVMDAPDMKVKITIQKTK